MDSINLVFTLTELKKVHLNKDLFEVPNYISKNKNLKFSIYARAEENLENNLDSSIDLVNAKKVKFIEYILRILKSNINKKLFMFFHPTKETFLQIIMLKMLIPRARIYLKLDLDQNFFSYRPSIFARLLAVLAFKLINITSIEDKKMFMHLNSNGIFGLDIRKKLIHVPNGTSIRGPSNSDKLNQIIIISRFNSYQKNTPLLFDFLNDVKGFRNYEIILVGPIEKDVDKFKKRIELLSKKINIRYLGVIDDRDLLINLISESKAIFNTSRYEGFAIIFPEAAICGATIISTNVNGFKDTTNNYLYGHLIGKHEIDPHEIKKLESYLRLLLNKNSQYFREISLWGIKNYSWDRILNQEIMTRIVGL